MFAAAGADVEEVIRCSDHGFFVFDDGEGVAAVAQIGHDFDQATDVARVEANGGFVEDEQSVGEGGAEAGGEVDAFSFTAAEGSRRAVEIEVAEADTVEVVEAAEDFAVQKGGGVVAGGEVLGEGIDQRQQPVNGELPEVGQGEPIGEFVVVFSGFVRGRDFEMQSLGLQARTATLSAFRVVAVAAEHDPHVHLVGARFEPVEEAAHAVPFVFFPGSFRIAGVFAFEHPLLLVFGQVEEGGVDVDVAQVAEAFKIVLALGVFFSLERANDAFGDGPGAVGQGAVEVDADDASEASAFRAGAEGIVEAEQRGCRRAQLGIGDRTGPAARVGGAVGGGLGIDELDAVFAEFEAALDGFLEAAGACGGDAVLDDVDEGREFFAVVLVGCVGAVDFTEDEDAQVALGLEKFEERSDVGGEIFGDGHAEGDEERVVPAEMFAGLAQD